MFKKRGTVGFKDLRPGEGVETAGQLERLRALGCDLAQDYHFSRPLPEGEMDELLAKNPPYP